ncbi:hypothetical protein K7X08_032294 [Anisodus acutangulus]|uniref:Uncharacterized protein n=1 Tax=Anisodus acutangulus TaxID=402998 RepID=A0A9Q1R3S4_9SOLA|nr:hypothetical protein K7X08_032294 [Anisodus acutangulus]
MKQADKEKEISASTDLNSKEIDNVEECRDAKLEEKESYQDVSSSSSSHEENKVNSIPQPTRQGDHETQGNHNHEMLEDYTSSCSNIHIGGECKDEAIAMRSQKPKRKPLEVREDTSRSHNFLELPSAKRRLLNAKNTGYT